ncbi:TetR/AcrR family transcriptional regulator [Acetobacter oeni]|uniref:TetR family transcriptional regulator n=1 Tax=Acetobacter oeni TaxID=304077 RepID=A0A511XGQ6_9PROT|nr:TetR/AcrR family transcriptional regulator [Acetobacter oeni]MBB3881694.1 AcrR family transcriptional regulator [Acetobacter oeni]NHO17501.1 TetR family transcriptional regulator [Acetobacter oeni]GBR05993.1 TetR family transcriptional regulator [Acetobacter oeni LMG 21952]GEN62135.1 TetR family transcriptional regulator [Acetobacter oeni]
MKKPGKRAGEPSRAGNDRSTGQTTRYHHGDLSGALLSAARFILDRDGVSALGLRPVTRAAGVSHTAAAHHFGDLAGLLSELAATGLDELRAAIISAAGTPRLIAEAYVFYALRHPHMFELMFRSDLIDRTSPRYRNAASALFAMLAGSPEVSDHDGQKETDGYDSQDAARYTAAWGLVHGIAVLATDGRLDPLISRLREPMSREDLVRQAILSVPPFL